jgi:hypothetical protein
MRRALLSLRSGKPTRVSKPCFLLGAICPIGARITSWKVESFAFGHREEQGTDLERLVLPDPSVTVEVCLREDRAPSRALREGDFVTLYLEEHGEKEPGCDCDLQQAALEVVLLEDVERERDPKVRAFPNILVKPERMMS